MIDGRHCMMDDYIYLNEKTNEIIYHISINRIRVVDDKINEFLHVIERFDSGIASNMRSELNKCISESQILEVINSCVDELRRSVLVDINEHK